WNIASAVGTTRPAQLARHRLRGVPTRRAARCSTWNIPRAAGATAEPAAATPRPRDGADQAGRPMFHVEPCLSRTGHRRTRGRDDRRTSCCDAAYATCRPGGPPDVPRGALPLRQSPTPPGLAGATPPARSADLAGPPMFHVEHCQGGWGDRRLPACDTACVV